MSKRDPRGVIYLNDNPKAAVKKIKNAFTGGRDTIQQQKKLGGKPEGLEGIKNFLFSDYYKSIPFNSISSRIMAKLITGRDPIQSGHSMDIKHAASAIPYVDIFITDRYMKHTIKQLGIDKDYNTQVYYVGDIQSVKLPPPEAVA